jgi:uncharacterized protein
VVRRAGPARPHPVRTCVGCRKRAPASELLRVTAVVLDGGGDSVTESDVDATGGATGGSGKRADVVDTVSRIAILPDPARRRPGRGAHLHHDPGCLDKAVRRRAFGRALRVAGAIETGAVVAYLRDHPTALPPGDGAIDGDPAGNHQHDERKQHEQDGTTDGDATRNIARDAQGRTTNMSTR